MNAHLASDDPIDSTSEINYSIETTESNYKRGNVERKVVQCFVGVATRGFCG